MGGGWRALVWVCEDPLASASIQTDVRKSGGGEFALLLERNALSKVREVTIQVCRRYAPFLFRNRFTPKIADSDPTSLHPNVDLVILITSVRS